MSNAAQRKERRARVIRRRLRAAHAGKIKPQMAPGTYWDDDVGRYIEPGSPRWSEERYALISGDTTPWSSSAGVTTNATAKTAHVELPDSDATLVKKKAANSHKKSAAKRTATTRKTTTKNKSTSTRVRSSSKKVNKKTSSKKTSKKKAKKKRKR